MTGSLSDPQNAVKEGMDRKGIKVTVTAIPIPMSCSPAFEGKSIRKEEMYVEFGGGRSPAFELLRVKPASEVTDGLVRVIGPEIGVGQGGVRSPARHYCGCGRKIDEKRFRTCPRTAGSIILSTMAKGPGMLHNGT